MEEILIKYFSGEATNEEIIQVQEWRSATENNAKTFIEFKKIWIESATHATPNQKMLTDIIGDSGEEAPKIMAIWEQRSFQLAVSILLILGVVFAVIRLNKNDQDYGIVVDQVTEYTLPDGSLAILQRGSSITLGDFEEQREVYLTGKAFFDVDRDEDIPFVVNTEVTSVRVLGTSFVVNALDESGAAEVLVESGEVAMAQSKGVFGQNAMEIKLSKGEMGIIREDERGIKKRKIRDDNFLSWTNRLILFKSTRLNDVAATLKDVYGVDFEFENQSLRNCKLTAKLHEKTPIEVAEIIAQTFNFTFKQEEGKFLFSGDGCR